MTPFDHPDWRALVAAVKAAPADDLPRLVAADWLDEHGQPERAEFVRVQCEIARIPGDPDVPHPLDNQHELERKRLLMRRERALLNADVPHPRGGGLKWSAWEAWLGADRVRCPTGASWFARGFVSRVECEAAVWWGGACGGCRGSGLDARRPEWGCGECGGSGHMPGEGRTEGVGPRIVAAHPVAEVVLSGVEPYHNGYGYSWFHVGRHRPSNGVHRASEIPPAVADMLRGYASITVGRFVSYDTADAAHAALSAAALQYAQSQTAEAK